MDNEPYPLLQGNIFKRMYNIGHLFESIYSLYSGKRFELEQLVHRAISRIIKS